MKKELLESVASQATRAARMKDFIAEYAHEINRVEAGLEPVKEWLISTDLDISNGSVDISYSGGKQVLTGIFTALRGLGYEPGSRPKDEKLSSFTCYWDHPKYKMRFWLTFSSTMCKRVKVGSKMVKQDIYETVCEG